MSKPKLNIAIKNELSSETLELHFLDYVYNETQFDWYTGTMQETNIVEDVIKQVKSYNPSKIKLVINSGGGDASIGLAIYNFLKNYPAKVETDNVGMACSIASVMMQCASKGKRMVARNSMTMIHQASGVVAGTSAEIRNGADVVDLYTQQCADVYAANNTKGKTADDVMALLKNGDYWMSGQEAIDMGFADEVYNSESVQVAASLEIIKSNYNNIPKSVLDADTPANLFTSFKNDLMEILNTIKASFKKVKEDAPTVLPAVTNAADIIGQIEAALTPTFQALETSVTNIEQRLPTPEELTEFRGISAKLVTANETIAQLQTDIENLLGGEAKPKGDKSEGPKPIGTFAK